MVDAGVARRVDFGEGRLRYEASHGHPRHFHLICSQCRRSSEFLSSDVETLLEEVSSVRGFEATQAIVQVHGVCQDCRTGTKTPALDGASTKRVFARDALRVAIETERQGLRFYTRAARLTRDAKGRKVFESLATEEKEHLGTLERRYAQLLEEDPALEQRPTFLFFKGAAGGLFAEGLDELRRGVDDEQALRIGIACERGSHRFFKRYGDRFEDSEGKRIFLEFADEERMHLELLQEELKGLQARLGKRRRR
jgi:rubrerythrin